MIREEMMAEAERLNEMADEVLSFNLQGVGSEDHILAAEALLAFYEASVKLQLNAAMDQDIEVDSEGGMMFFRYAAELHIKIAQAKRA